MYAHLVCQPRWALRNDVSFPKRAVTHRVALFTSVAPYIFAVIWVSGVLHRSWPRYSEPAYMSVVFISIGRGSKI